jgi:hypothetical protein
VALGDRRGAYRFWQVNMNDNDYFDDLGVDGKIILKKYIKEIG